MNVSRDGALPNEKDGPEDLCDSTCDPNIEREPDRERPPLERPVCEKLVVDPVVNGRPLSPPSDPTDVDDFIMALLIAPPHALPNKKRWSGSPCLLHDLDF